MKLADGPLWQQLAIPAEDIEPGVVVWGGQSNLAQRRLTGLGGRPDGRLGRAVQVLVDKV